MKQPKSGLQNKHLKPFSTLLKGYSYISGLQLAGLVLILAGLILPSCKNDLETIRALDIQDTLPDMSARDVEILYSERSRVQVKLIAPLLVRREMDEEPVIEFPEGFEVFFYDSAFHVKSTMTGDYGISYENRKLMEARHNVIVENRQTEERLNTEQLYWDRMKETIYSNKFVRITRGEEVITADGLISDQSFENMEFTNPRGLIEVEEEE
jgi:LPS export ABC transporter protein LptC